MRYPPYSNNSSLARSNLLLGVCIDAAARPRTYVATSKIQYARPRGSLGEPVFIAGVEPPALADATRVSGLPKRFSPSIPAKARGYDPRLSRKSETPLRVRGTSGCA